MFSNESIISGFEVGRARTAETRALTVQSSLSLFSRFWKGGLGAIRYVIRHPVQAITLGLAAQSAVVKGFDQTVSLSTLNGQTGFSLEGVAAGDYSGHSVATAGDVNGDGIGDLIIGAPWANSATGASYVVFGHTGAWSSPFSLSSLNGVNGFSLTDPSSGVSGCSVATAGDVNGDGIEDLIIGADRANSWAGASYVVFGHTGTWTSPFPLSSLNGVNGFTLTGAAANDVSGNSVATAGDVNGDGIGDLIIGAHGVNSRTGASYVVFGHTGTWSSPFSLSSLNGINGFTLTGVAAWDYAGHSVSAAGDVNGDGIGDLIIGAPYVESADTDAGASYVIFGHRGTWSSSLSLASLNGVNGFILTGVAADEWSGLSVASAGDVNGDGIGDLIIGSPGTTGASYVVFGHSGTWNSPLSLSSLNGVNGFSLRGVTAGDWTGHSVSAAGDVNGDGIGDLIIGAFAANNGAGASYVVFGHRGTWNSPLSLSSLNGINGFSLRGVAAGDWSGNSLSAAGDVNGDGRADLIIGALSANSGAGASYVFFGFTASTSPSATPAPSFSSLAPEFQVNTYTYNYQHDPKIAVLANGGFVITWDSYGQDGSGWGVYSQLYSATGFPIGDEFRVSTYTINHQYGPSIAAFADGSFIVTWGATQDGSSYGVYGQRYGATGVAIGNEFQINTYTNDDQLYSPIATFADGGFVVVWSSFGQDGSGFGIYAQRYDAVGTRIGDEFQVNTYSDNNQLYPSISAFASGGFVVTWQSGGQDGSGYGIYGQRYDVTGTRVADEFRVNTYTDNFQQSPHVATLVDGGFVVTWGSSEQDLSGYPPQQWNNLITGAGQYGIYVQRYDSNGIALGSEFKINTGTDDAAFDFSSVAAFKDGGFVVTWGSSSIYGRKYDAMGTPLGDEFQINTYTKVNRHSSVAAFADGGFVVTWASQGNIGCYYFSNCGQDGSGYGVYARVYPSSYSNTLPLSISPSATEKATPSFMPTSTATPTPQSSGVPCNANFNVAVMLATMMTECANSEGNCAGQFRASPTLLFNRITNDENARQKLRQATTQKVCQRYLASPIPSAGKRDY